MFMRFVLGLALGLLLLSTSRCLATYGALVLIPTADVVGDGNYSIEFQLDGSLPDKTSETRFFNSQFGFGDRLEAGVDFDFSKGAESKVLLNAKYVFGVVGDQDLLLAAGVHSIEPNSKSVAYLVASKNLGDLRLHLGGHRRNGGNHWLAGFDWAVGERWTVMADYTSGSEDYSSAGFNYQFDERFGIMAGTLFPNASGDTLYTVHFVYGGSCARRVR